MIRNKLIAGNWKMNLTLQQASILVSEIVNMVKDEYKGNAEIAMIPPFVYLQSIPKLFQNQSNIFIGAQNCAATNNGAYTGEISAEMLFDLSVKYVILGHSERRQFFKETNAIIAQKFNKALAHNLIPILCCGETLHERQAGQLESVVLTQLADVMEKVDPSKMENIVIAYEPVWAIGTGVTATPAEAQAVHAMIRNWLANTWNEAFAQKIRILYGGSMNAANAKSLLDQPDIDGGLIGGASLKSRDFVNIILNA